MARLLAKMPKHPLAPSLLALLDSEDSTALPEVLQTFLLARYCILHVGLRHMHDKPLTFWRLDKHLIPIWE